MQSLAKRLLPQDHLVTEHVAEKMMILSAGGICCTVVVGIASEGKAIPFMAPFCCCLFVALVIAWRVTAGGDDDVPSRHRPRARGGTPHARARLRDAGRAP